MDDGSGLGFPSARELAGSFRAQVEAWHLHDPLLDWKAVTQLFALDGETGTAGLRYLAFVNCFQWHLEDRCRAVYEQPERLAALKQEIDASNARRVRAVDGIDRHVAARLEALHPPGGARIALVTPGALADRLSILVLKRYHAAARSDGKQLLGVLADQIADLCDGTDALLADLMGGRLRLKFYPTVKLFSGDSAAGSRT